MDFEKVTLTYFIAGCDDSSINLPRLGWKTALKLVKEQTGRDAVFAALVKKYKDENIDLMKQEFDQLITCKIDLFYLFMNSLSRHSFRFIRIPTSRAPYIRLKHAHGFLE